MKQLMAIFFITLFALYGAGCDDGNGGKKADEDGDQSGLVNFPEKCDTPSDCTISQASCLSGTCIVTGCETDQDCLRAGLDVYSEPGFSCRGSYCLYDGWLDYADLVDGDEDEVIPDGQCSPGEREECGSADAENTSPCKMGFRVCDEQGQWTNCIGNVDPETETCDGVDNDCDGEIDEEFNLAEDPENCGECGYSCQAEFDGLQVAEFVCEEGLCEITACESGKHDANLDPEDGCEYPEGEDVCYVDDPDNPTEICEDDRDNDCDGETDEEECTCQPNDIRRCGPETAEGECEFGIQTCLQTEDQTWEWGECEGAVMPAEAELCDGKDNDCDGETDEDYEVGEVCTGQGICGEGVYECDPDNAEQVICSTMPGGSESQALEAEECNGLDDDCDGQVPEDEVDQDEDGILNCAGDCDDQDPAVFPEAEEICDGKDNNCDGEKLETEVDLDQDGFLACEECNDLNKLIHPEAEEICDGLDNNCDDQIPANEADEDEDGFRICEGDCDDALATINPDVLEICDGVDNNCDDQIDEGFGIGEPCEGLGACGVGVVECAGETETRCSTEPGGSADESIAEDCGNELDDDCDGVVNNGCICFPGQTRQCGTTNVGECQYGVETCAEDGKSWLECVGAVEPAEAESCNGLDDDCDGVIPVEEADEDEDGVRVCAGDCNDAEATINPLSLELCDGIDNNCDEQVDEGYFVGSACVGIGACGDTPGTLECATDNSVQCNTMPGGSADASATEVCDNGMDDDCDGLVDLNDDDCNCRPASTRACGPETDQGICEFGVQTCNPAGDGWGECVGAVMPEESELCNGLDDDCDGSVPAEEADEDEDGVRVCAGDCNDAEATINPLSLEICDGLDNNCDEQVDESFGVGNACQGVGACGVGVLECATTTTVMCDTMPGGSADASSEEVCGNRLDDDCDGLVDINDAECVCVAGVTRQCGTTDVGACEYGLETCAEDGKSWLECVGAVEPAEAESCNGLDDDCDGVIPAEEADEDEDGIKVCDNDCDDLDPDNFPGNAELCDGQDNDCDGMVDEDFFIGASCNGIGVCGAGTIECATFNTYRCSTMPGGSEDMSGVESCGNSLDDDCDGSVNEGCTCVAGETRDCGSANEQGICVFGTQTCSPDGMSWGDCLDAIMPEATELCNGLDDDCDGSVPVNENDSDEDGVRICEGDTVDNDSSVYPGASELCDGKDNDLDGQTDEDYFVGALCYGLGACAGPGVIECDGLNDYACSTMPGRSEDMSVVESCDGVDNDCDGTTDEGCICQAGAVRDCGPANEQGICEFGTQVCLDGFTWGDCEDAVMPLTSEVCNDLDDDCDGQVDETFNKSTDEANCGGCGNDCNTLLQNTSATGCVSGVCRVNSCVSGYYDANGNDEDGCEYGPCGMTNGGTEACDGVDNDCNGEVDEGFDLQTDRNHCGACGNSCSYLQYLNVANYSCQEGSCQPDVCNSGYYDVDENPRNGCEYACSPVNPGVEVCDGEDNDCDGRTDEGCLTVHFTCPVDNTLYLVWGKLGTGDNIWDSDPEVSGTKTVSLRDVCVWGNHEDTETPWLEYNCHNETDWLAWPENNGMVTNVTNVELGGGTPYSIQEGFQTKAAVTIDGFDCNDLDL